MQGAKPVLGHRGRRAACTAFNSVVSSVPAARRVFNYRKGSVIPNNHVCIALISQLYYCICYCIIIFTMLFICGLGRRGNMTDCSKGMSFV